jgi:protoheme IX farnesyltransferase
VLVGVTLLPLTWSMFGVGYTIAALVLGAIFIWMAWRLRRAPSPRGAALLFHYSLLYLALLFVAMALDAVVGV